MDQILENGSNSKKMDQIIFNLHKWIKNQDWIKTGLNSNIPKLKKWIKYQKWISNIWIFRSKIPIQIEFLNKKWTFGILCCLIINWVYFDFYTLFSKMCAKKGAISFLHLWWLCSKTFPLNAALLVANEWRRQSFSIAKHKIAHKMHCHEW